MLWQTQKLRLYRAAQQQSIERLTNEIDVIRQPNEHLIKVNEHIANQYERIAKENERITGEYEGTAKENARITSVNAIWLRVPFGDNA